MRAKVLLLAAGLAVLVLAPVVYFHFKPASPAQDSTPVAEQPAPTPETVAPPVAAHPRVVAGPADKGEGVQSADADDSEMSHDDIVAARKGELMQMGLEHDPANLKVILSELNNKDPEIRGAALAATIQFDSKDAVPALKNEMAWAEDPQEKVDIQNAINYLELPSFGEYQASAEAAQGMPAGDQPAPSN